MYEHCSKIQIPKVKYKKHSCLSITTDTFSFNINRTTKWYNLNNRGCKPTDHGEVVVSALQGLNIRLV